MQLALQITLVVTSVLVVLLVLLHRAKGGGLSTLFGGGVQSSLSGSTVVEKNLDGTRIAVSGDSVGGAVGVVLSGVLTDAFGWRTVIAGLESVDVGPDARVSDGQTLGRSGPDGDVYFELRRDERPIDPGPWLR